MATFHWQDNLNSTAFTPRDFQVELLAAAIEKNIIVCLGHNSSKEFIALKLISEKSHELRRTDNRRKITIYITSTETGGESAYNLVFHLTDLKVINFNAKTCSDNVEWKKCFENFQVVIFDLNVCLEALIASHLDLATVNLIIIEDCHKKYSSFEIDQLFQFIRKCDPKPKIFGLAGPLHSAGCTTDQLGFHLELLEKNIQCKAETASDIVTVLRYCTKPSELVVQCLPASETEVSTFLRELIETKKHFLREHRFDPSEIYSDGFEDELKAIPDPKKEPLDCLDQFLDVLNEFGPWCADRAALNLIAQIEKAKIKTPYERHFLLLCLVSTTLIQIRSYCDHVFQQIPNEKDRIETYSSPKVLRIFEILRQFKPDKKATESDLKSAQANAQELNSLNFQGLLKKVHHIAENIENHQPEFSEVNQNLVELVNANQKCVDEVQHTKNSVAIKSKPYGRGGGGKKAKIMFPRFLRTYNNNHSNDPDALCGLIFCNLKFVAKILFNVIYEMSKADADLDYLSVQFTGDRPSDPIMENKQSENEHRKQEEVLKRFRMHSCNLLIGTSVLEEGIELPKCNLVIRWDLPATYRSYVQCKGRARSQKAYHIIMVAASRICNESLACGELLSNKSHRHICGCDKNNVQFSESIVNASDLETTIIAHTDSESKVSNRKVSNLIQTNLDGMECETENIIKLLSQYIQIEKILLSKCSNREPTQYELNEADQYTDFIKPYQPIKSDGDSNPFVNLSTAIVLVNKYCAKLPSDTFTKLTPLWRCSKTDRKSTEYFQYTVRLPINSPVKQDILGLPMPSKILARRMAALITCKVLHQSGELDDFLQPIGKEGFRAAEPDWNNFDLEKVDAEIVSENLDPRPGTTRRRQYYYKRIASVFSGCRPTVGTNSKLYHIKMTLECPIPEEQNTRGRKIYAPEDAIQGFGILTSRKIPKLGSFSIFTRSGEVRVSLELASDNIVLCDQKLLQVNTFLKYLFANVLRLQKYLMFFDPNATENSFFVVPTVKDANNVIDIDWSFLQLITEKCDQAPKDVPEAVRKVQQFDREKFHDAVVMPWYRNQDQPQYFYVAEICDYLSPKSSFPGDSYDTFKEYYFKKYNIAIQNCNQPLLDVDHTSARLNFLTPRYVNRKGVALPTSSEETKRAKRENLEQKQILVPELCTIHPFPASLWRVAVCLPCILYRINALLLADEIRIEVANDISLGRCDVDDAEFEWPILDFGWKLVDVLRRAKDAKPKDVKKTDESVDDMAISIEKLTDSGFESEVKKSEDKNDDKKNTIDLLEDVEKKLKDDCLMEIGTWSNAMAENINFDENSSEEEWDKILPPNISMCSRNNINVSCGSPTPWDVPRSKDFLRKFCMDSDVSCSDQSDDDYFYQSDEPTDDGLNIEFKSDNLAEAIETPQEIQKRQRQLEIINDINANEKYYQSTKNIGSGYDCPIYKANLDVCSSLQRHKTDFQASIIQIQEQIKTSGILVKCDEIIKIDKKRCPTTVKSNNTSFEQFADLFSFLDRASLKQFIAANNCIDESGAIKLSLDDVYELHRMYFKTNECERYVIEGAGSVFDAFNDNNFIQFENGGIGVSMNSNEFFRDRTVVREKITDATEICENTLGTDDESVDNEFSFDKQPDLNNHPGPSPSIILQALTMSNANDGINLERLETIGDSFLKYAITTYLYCTYENVHEGKLSHLRSRQVSNLNLYRLGRRKMLGESMIATKFEPHDNWLPPCYYVPKDLEKALIEAKIPACYWENARLLDVKELSVDEICQMLKKNVYGDCKWWEHDGKKEDNIGRDINESNFDYDDDETDKLSYPEDFPCFIPYNLVTQHSIPDKSIADCVEALIGANLIDCGPRGALLFMAWLGIRVLPWKEIRYDKHQTKRIPGSTKPYERDDIQYQTVYGYWAVPKSPLLYFAPDPLATLELLLDGYSAFEAHIGYYFNDRSYLLQAMTHASYSPNRLTDCYQRLEFLGDAVLDYLITRHLYEDPRQHSPGALTDLRSALVNNTIFASLAVRHGFHKYFRHLSPGLNDVIDRFVRIQEENGHSISEEFYLISEEECDEAEDVEVPKALGDVFESVAGAIFLDSKMSLDMVWKVYRNMMRPEIEQFSNSVPKSPIRELLELEPETAKFGKPEKLADGRRVRVTVDVFGKGTYRGIGRNYRIAKCTAAKCALRQLKKQGLINRKRLD